ncbi:MAG: ABC transporter ATP-binding protein/permease [Clostridia bacterium]|nr:ABC transporter ATP-binding protein/permease [Clostridia bacterium]
MLSLKNIKKDYILADETVSALKGISLDFRKNEFVSILGQSGCGKTTLLNIVGGLDSYTSGDLVINGVSTKKYKNKDWDNYRNHSIGFIFQSYNLIPHQNVLKNVELALTLSGVSKKERKKRAIAALKEVGLEKQLYKKPNQMSGGQMQRVAIARALVNNPEILLADEPTGALDSETGTQVMELLKQIAHDRLVIMVTHNPEIAEKYSTRIINLLDGNVISDSNPPKPEELEAPEQSANKKAAKKTSMSFFTALSLSFNNLMTKKTRTVMTSFAGSIGIIGIALILSLSNGIQLYINKVQEDALSSYPITLEETTLDISSMLSAMIDLDNSDTTVDDNKIYSNNIMTDMLSAVSKGSTQNNLADFKKYIETGGTNLNDLVTDIQYGYSTPINIYKADTSNGLYKVNPGEIFNTLGFNNSDDSSLYGSAQGYMTNTDVWKPLLNNQDLLKSQYDILAGKIPENFDEAVLVIDKDNTVSDYTLYTLGLKDADELEDMSKAILEGNKFETEQTSYSFEEILNLRFKLLLNTDYFEKNGNIYEDKQDDEVYLINKLKTAQEIKVVGILRPNDDTSVMTQGGYVGYLSSLNEHLITKVTESPAAKQQLENPETDIFTGLPFKTEKEYTLDEIMAFSATLPAAEQAQMTAFITQMKSSGMSDQKIAETLSKNIFKSSGSTYQENLKKFGISDLEKPSSINIYPKDFESKDKIANIITTYNNSVSESDQITYTDYVGIMMSSVSTIINAISYVLIAFVSISLVVSSIMIGIITYISVLERTKEIGILRAIGASKKDISRVFNAETLIVGLVSGIFGILATLLLNIPINYIIQTLANITAEAQLPPAAAIILVAISMLLTFVAGLIPSGLAAKKDPVVALRTE